MANRNTVEARARISPAVRAAWIEAGGTLAMFDGPASPLTQTFGLGMIEPATAAQLDTIESFFRERGAPVHHETCPLGDSALVPLLTARGYRFEEYSNVMYRPVAGGEGAAEPNPDIAVSEVVADAADRWARTAAEGWSEQPGLGEFLLEIGRVQAAAADAHRFLAELDGRPIAAGALAIHGGIALLAGASTIPAGRRQGAQLALLRARLAFAAANGCDLAMMVAQPGSGSQRNAERHGFRVAYTRVKWLLP